MNDDQLTQEQEQEYQQWLAENKDEVRR